MNGISQACIILCRILEILNEIPATSRKYEFVLATADRIITDNQQQRDIALLDINRAALCSAFSHTCKLLGRSPRRSEAVATATWPSRLLRHLPLGPHLAACYKALRLSLNNVLNDTDVLRSSNLSGLKLAITRPDSSSVEWMVAEELAHELPWITNKMKACSMAGDAVVMWGFASGLASLALTAHPRVQGPTT